MTLQVRWPVAGLLLDDPIDGVPRRVAAYLKDMIPVTDVNNWKGKHQSIRSTPCDKWGHNSVI